MLGEARKDPELRRVFEDAALAVPESVATLALSRLKGLQVSERIPGIDLLLELCRFASLKGWGIYLVGSKPGVAEKAGQELLNQFHGLKILGCHDGYFDSEEEKRLLQDIALKKPYLLFAGLSSPLQEIWIYKNRDRFQGIIAMGVGGTLDVVSGSLKRAPPWMRKAGLEWLFRALQEPYRIKRLLSIPLFFLIALISKSEFQTSN